MKRPINFLIALAVCAAMSLAAYRYLGRHAHAEPEIPAKLAPLDAAHLDAALAHLFALQAQETPHVAMVQAIGKTYGFTLADVLQNRIGFNFATGEIARPQK